MAMSSRVFCVGTEQQGVGWQELVVVVLAQNSIQFYSGP